jgi:DNA recombination-dependent growth factor C
VKTNKLIKAFIPYAISGGFHEWCGKAARKPNAAAGVIGHFLAKDPGDHEWSNMGLVPVIPFEDNVAHVHDLDGAAYLLMFQWSERKLPASVRDEEVSKRFKELTEREGRALNKKEYAQLREDVESSLLPQAFITRKYVPVLVTRDTMFVCTSSASMCEKVLGHIVRLCETRNVKIEFGEKQAAATPGSLLNNIARTGIEHVDDDGDHGRYLEAGTTAVFKGEDKRTIRVKDRDLSSEELSQVLADRTYAVTELMMTLRVGSDEVCTFTMTDKMIFKGIKLSDIVWAGVSEADADDLHVSYWMMAKEVMRILDVVMIVLREGQPAPTDDEEL